MVPPWKIRATNRAGKQDISHKGEPVGKTHKDHMARCMTGTVHDLEHLIAHRDRIPILEPTIGREGG